MEKILFLNNIKLIFSKYVQHGATSKQKVDCLHNFLRDSLSQALDKLLASDEYQIKLECNVPSLNYSRRKKCDIVMYKGIKIIAIFPVKFIMSNYSQNRNNAWENLTGELLHIKWANADVHLIPINVMFNKMPYLLKNKKIKHFENITTQKSFCHMDVLKKKSIVTDMVNYIIDVDHICKPGDDYTICPKLIDFNVNTPYRDLQDILRQVITNNVKADDDDYADDVTHLLDKLKIE